MFKNVMMVCICNKCRSPIAEVYLQHHQTELNVLSSGLGALVGKPADTKSVALMEVIDMGLEKHCAQQINSVLLSAPDLVLAMGQSHVETIQSKFPEYRGKVHLIGKCNDNQEVPGPYKKYQKIFETASAVNESGLDVWQKKLWA